MEARQGSSKARNELAAMDGFERFREVFKRGINAGMSEDEASKVAQQSADASLLNRVGDVKVTADSARRIGAGGFATSSDPMKTLAEQRNIMLSKISEGINNMADKMPDLAEAITRTKLR